MAKNIYYYSIGPFVCCYKVSTVFDIEEDGEWIAEESANDYHDSHDGWESSWPLVINLHKEDEGEIVSSFTVERESEPVFSATIKEESK